VPTDRVFLPILHGAAALLALAAALVWPRPGQAALLVPVSGGGMATALAWAEAEQADYLTIDPARERVIARVPSNISLMRALGSGIVPVAARGAGPGHSPTRRALRHGDLPVFVPGLGIDARALARPGEAQVALVESSGRTQPRITLVAPIAGVVAELMAREGMTVMPGAALFRINGLGTVWADAAVRADYRRQLAEQVPKLRSARQILIIGRASVEGGRERNRELAERRIGLGIRAP